MWALTRLLLCLSQTDDGVNCFPTSQSSLATFASYHSPDLGVPLPQVCELFLKIETQLQCPNLPSLRSRTCPAHRPHGVVWPYTCSTTSSPKLVLWGKRNGPLIYVPCDHGTCSPQQFHVYFLIFNMKVVVRTFQRN